MDKTRPDILAFDGNLNAATITELLRSQSKKAAKLITFFEPTSTAKALRILPYFEQQAASGYEPDRKIHHVSPNRMELEALWMGAKERNLLCKLWASKTLRLLTLCPAFEQINSRNLPNTFTDVIAKHLPAFIQKEGLAQMGIQLLQFFGTIWVKLGSQGLLMIRLSSHPTDFKSKKNIIVHRTPQEQDVILRYYPAIKVSQESIVSVTGAGDSLAGALVRIAFDDRCPILIMFQRLPAFRQANHQYLYMKKNGHAMLWSLSRKKLLHYQWPVSKRSIRNLVDSCWSSMEW